MVDHDCQVLFLQEIHWKFSSFIQLPIMEMLDLQLRSAQGARDGIRVQTTAACVFSMLLLGVQEVQIGTSEAFGDPLRVLHV